MSIKTLKASKASEPTQDIERFYELRHHRGMKNYNEALMKNTAEPTSLSCTMVTQ